MPLLLILFKIVNTIPAKWSPTCIAASGNVVAVGGADKNLYVFENTNGKLTEVRKTTHTAALASCAVSADGALVAGGDATKNYVVCFSFNRRDEPYVQFYSLFD